MSFYETIEASFELCIRFLSNLYKNSIANDCFVNLSDLSKMLVKTRDVPLDHVWRVPILQEKLNTRMNNLYMLKDSMIT